MLTNLKPLCVGKACLEHGLSLCKTKEQINQLSELRSAKNLRQNTKNNTLKPKPISLHDKSFKTLDMCFKSPRQGGVTS